MIMMSMIDVDLLLLPLISLVGPACCWFDSVYEDFNKMKVITMR